MMTNERPAWLSAETVATARRNLRSHFVDQLDGKCQGCRAQGVEADWPCYSAAVAREVLVVALAVGPPADD